VTQFDRVFAWAGGAAFVASLACFAWWYFVALQASGPWLGWGPVVADTGMFCVFALHHSVFAREPLKERLTAIPVRLRKSVYVWIASLLLIIVCLAWRRVGGTLYDFDGAIAVVMAAVQLTGVALIARAVRGIDALELAGIRDVITTPATSGAPTRDPLQTSGPYRLVRHPLYLGWFLVVFGPSRMTGDRLTFAAISMLYLIIAVPYEEQSLVRAFGEEYTRYMQRVRWRILPYVY
jgi:methanethiol S-methyltransferase